MKFKLLTPFAAAAILISGCQEQKIHIYTARIKNRNGRQLADDRSI